MRTLNGILLSVLICGSFAGLGYFLGSEGVVGFGYYIGPEKGYHALVGQDSLMNNCEIEGEVE